MKKSYIVGSIYNNMRIDRWIRNNIEKIPQSLIEKNLRNGKIKINNKKVRSSFKIKSQDKIDIYNFNYKKNLNETNKKAIQPNSIIKSTEKQIIDMKELYKKSSSYIYKLLTIFTGWTRECCEITVTRGNTWNGTCKYTM